MNRQSVDSTDIKSVGYDPATKILEIEFHSGGIYQYLDVPDMVYSDLMNADSKGKYFHRHVKNVYNHRKV